MKNRYLLHLIIFTAALYIIINILVFTLVPYARLNNAQFWVSWSFMFGVNSTLTVIIGYKFIKKSPFDIRIVPILLLVGGIVVYLALGIIFTCLLPPISYVVITDFCMAIVFALLILRSINSVTHARKLKEFRKNKISYVRKLTNLIDSYASFTTDEEILREIKKLAADFRFSDPMSHESLKSKEQSLMEMVESLEKELRGGDKAKILSLISSIRLELKLRNSICADLK